ncbi:MAG: hypothetical protein NVV59_16655 [Chitinophagaceae bacterium]|nr:hypothetical protein [Chitinophagaceae bacterium]
MQKELDNLDFPAKAKNEFGISIVEYVNQFLKTKLKTLPISRSCCSAAKTMVCATT